MKKIIFWIAGGIILGAVFIYIFSEDILPKDNKKVVLGEKEFELEVADNQRERIRGLSGREAVCSNCGMIFEFSETGKYSFIMKDMNFNLDFIWIKDNRIVEIEKNVSRLKQESFGGKVEADKVIEINAGTCDELELKVGDELSL